MGKFIFDPLTGDPTILAANRAKRPDQTGGVGSAVTSIVGHANEKTAGKKTFVNPFAKGNEAMTPITVYQDCDDWNVRVFSNKYPLLDDHEIIVHSPYEDKDIEDLPHEHNMKIIRAYLNRAEHYNKQEKEVIIFNNRGGKAGASLLHPHSQIVAAKGFPGELEKEREYALHYFNEHNTSYWLDSIKKELIYKERIVINTKHFVLFVPEACRWSYELQLVPKSPKPNIADITEQELDGFARVLKMALQGYNTLFNRPDRNFWIHTSRFEPYHWHVGFIPHIKVFGALELGCGIWVSDKAVPEDAAAQLRQAITSLGYDLTWPKEDTN